MNSMSSVTSSANSLRSPKLPQTRKMAGQVKKPLNRAGSSPKTAMARAAKQTPPVPNVPHASPFEIMAARLANRVAEMAENITFTEREKYVIPAPKRPHLPPLTSLDPKLPPSTTSSSSSNNRPHNRKSHRANSKSGFRNRAPTASSFPPLSSTTR
jgi:hypothetical protein